MRFEITFSRYDFDENEMNILTNIFQSYLPLFEKVDISYYPPPNDTEGDVYRMSMDKDLFLEFNTIEELLEFKGLVGPCLLHKDGITVMNTGLYGFPEEN